jgi:hypothetical protein
MAQRFEQEVWSRDSPRGAFRKLGRGAYSSIWVGSFDWRNARERCGFAQHTHGMKPVGVRAATAVGPRLGPRAGVA